MADQLSGDEAWARSLTERTTLLAPAVDVDVRGAVRRGRHVRAARTAATAGLAVLTLAVGGIALAQVTPPSAPPASPEVVRVPEPTTTPGGEFEGTWEEYAQALAGCLRDGGWDAQVSHDDGLSIEILDSGDGTEAALTDSQELCRARIGTKDGADLSDAELRAQYDGQVAQFECLVEAGFSATAGPSFEFYVEEYRRAGWTTWDPMLGVSPGEYFDALDACPRPAPVG